MARETSHQPSAVGYQPAGSAGFFLEARGLTKHFPVTRGVIIKRRLGTVRAVDGVDFRIQAGETFGLVGESGCGKTTTGKLVVGLERPTAGELIMSGPAMHGGGASGAPKNSVQMVFQNPYSSLNPRMRVGNIIAEPLTTEPGLSRRDRMARVRDLVGLVGLPVEAPDLYPHEFSGGQRQRIAVARAMAPNPRLIVLDEPVSALDVSIRAQILNLLSRLQEQFHIAYLLISHDLAAVHHLSQRVGVMYLGKLVELADSDPLYAKPLHPYTQLLLSAALPADPDHTRERIVASGEVPNALNPPPGCRFHTRCPVAFDRCRSEEPLLREVEPGRLAACHLYK